MLCAMLSKVSTSADAALAARIIAVFPGLAELAPATLLRIVREGVHRKVPAGTLMFDIDTPCPGFPLVPSGTVRVLQRYENGRELHLYSVHPGESCLLSGGSLLGRSRYPATGEAATDVEVLVLPPPTFEALIADDEVFRRHVFALFGERLADLMEVVEAVANRELDQRLAALLLDHDAENGEIRMTHQALADQLGSVREIISRLLRGFEDRGWVDLGRERIRILDRTALARVGRG
jgi:CRP/FNR family transcriptional regulator, anaerobic regulatory protein